jgi:hypothetical protein
MLLAELPGVRISVVAQDFSFFQNVQTGPGAHAASCLVGTTVLFLGLSGQGVMLTSHVH